MKIDTKVSGKMYKVYADTRGGSSGGASIVQTVMVVAWVQSIVAYALLIYTANVCDLSRSLMPLCLLSL